MAERVADLLAGLSRLADLGFGLPAGTASRSCVLAVALGRSLGLPEHTVRAAFHTSLLHHVGCTGYAHETARAFGDELALNAAAARTDPTTPRDLFATFLPTLTAGRPPLDRLRLSVASLARGAAFGAAYTTAACEVGRDAARRLGLGDDVQQAVLHVYEVWRGGGQPAGLAGDDIPVASRLARLAGVAVLFDGLGGPALAADRVRHRAGGMLDPTMAHHFSAHAADLLAVVGDGGAPAVCDAEPAPFATVRDPELPDVAAVFGDLADLKSPFTHGHARGVAALARGAGERLGLGSRAVAGLGIAGLLHDVGRVAISNRIWEKGRPLTLDEREQVRLHPYHSERILAGSPRLSRLAPLVGRHHERLDATGYHRGCGADDLSMAARVLGAADAYQAMTQRRPHRPALPPGQAREQVAADVRSGRLDGDASGAVLAAAGHAVPAVRRAAPAGLTDREVEVLALVAGGCSNREIAERLVISRRTAEHHVQHVYAKIGVSSRAAAALFAMEHDLLADG